LEYKADNEKILLRYLLGELDEKEQKQIELRYFDDDEFFHHLQVVEDDLIDRYVRQKLSGTELNRFESYYLRSAQRYQRVEVAKIWLEYITRNPSLEESSPLKEGPAIRKPFLKSILFWAPLAATICLLVGGSWLFIERDRTRTHLKQARNEVDALKQERAELQRRLEEERLRNDQLAQQVEDRVDSGEGSHVDRPSSRETALRVVTFLLVPGSIRGGGGVNNLPIPPGAKSVRLQVEVMQDDYKSYRASLTTVEGREVLGRSGLKTLSGRNGKVLILSVPVKQLNPNDYILTIIGITASQGQEVTGQYPLRVSIK
jgi:hypothetical protein